MQIVDQIEPARRAVRDAQRDGKHVGLVPTMGALHEGHLALIRAARQHCPFTAVSIFVNPTQFAPGEDLAHYPRPLEADLAACRREGVDLVFTPAVDTMYPAGAATTIHVAGLTDGLCGPHRPGHFDGVATVVAKLFHILPADAAFFGEKDYQQLKVIQRMVQDLNFPIKIVPCPTVREPDGLAMSSRNAYLSPDDRRRAAALSAALFHAAEQIGRGERHAKAITAEIRRAVLAAGAASIDYIDIVDPETLAVLHTIDRPARICAAIHVGATRLIDNVPASPVPL